MSAESAERPLTVSELCASRPGARGAKRLSPSTITRWILTGARGVSGERVRLRAERCGSRWLVYPTHFREFLEALNPVDAPQQTPQRSPAERDRAAEAAGEKLRAMGC